MAKIVHRDAKKLAGTPKTFRKLEIASLVCFPIVWSIAMWRTAPAIATWPTLMLLGALSGLLAADFVSGFFHWLFDTWGSPEVPWVGPTLIRTFREHHVDQLAITRHDFIETNGTNVLFGLLPASGALFFDPLSTKTDAFFATMLCFMAAFTSMTSQVHKWAHMPTPPRAIALLQRTRILLSPEHHVHHHTAPFIKNYCINCGWMNGPLAQIRFFPILERIITSLTGALPRKDDIGAEAAIETVESEIKPLTRIASLSEMTQLSEIAQRDGDVVLASAREGVVDEELAQSGGRGVPGGPHRLRE